MLVLVEVIRLRHDAGLGRLLRQILPPHRSQGSAQRSERMCIELFLQAVLGAS